MLLHEKDTRPDILERGLKITPGVEMSVGFSLKTSKYLSSPYGKCKSASGYRQANCFQRCLSNYISEICRCVDIDMIRKSIKTFFFKLSVN